MAKRRALRPTAGRPQPSRPLSDARTPLTVPSSLEAHRAHWTKHLFERRLRLPVQAPNQTRRRGGEAAAADRRRKADALRRKLERLREQKPERSWKELVRESLSHDRDWLALTDRERDKKVEADLRRFHRSRSRKNR